MEETFADDFSGVLNANFDSNMQLQASKMMNKYAVLENYLANKTISNPNVQELIEELFNYKEALEKRIGAIVSEKMATLLPVAEPISVEKQKTIIKSGVIDKAIERLNAEIEDLKKENKELEETIISMN